MGKSAVFLAILLAGCSSDFRVAWLGAYDVEIEEVIRPCDDWSADPAVNVSASTWRLELVDDRLVVAGRCTFPLDARTSTYALFERMSCSGRLEDGRSVTVYVLGGTLYREGDMIWGSQDFEADVEGLCIMGRANINGWRF